MATEADLPHFPQVCAALRRRPWRDEHERDRRESWREPPISAGNSC
jgi:hypothetical protein